VHQVRYCATGSAVETEFNVVSVDTGGRAPTPTPRLGTTTSSCGLCGSASLDALAARLVPRSGALDFDLDLVLGVMEKVRSDQELFHATGSVHAAAAYDATTGAVDIVREDVGRHNAVDKVVGRLLLDGKVPATDRGLFVSGRVSFEIVQKAWAAGFGQIAAVSGPTSLAVETAVRANITLAGFVRDRGANLYT
jgi:FdhD protein